MFNKMEHNKLNILDSVANERLQNNYERKEDGQESYFCKECNKDFGFTKAYIEHLKIYHDVKKPYSCRRCNLTFFGAKGMNSHLTKHHNEKIDEETEPRVKKLVDGTYGCYRCDKSFKNATYIYSHWKSHFEECFLCIHCDQKFRLPAQLRVHLSSHNAGDYKFKCSYCYRRFKNEQLLSNHLKDHDKEPTDKPKCDTCGKCFKTVYVLRTHQRKYCGKPKLRKTYTFSSRANQAACKPEESGEYLCHICSMQFSKEVAVKSHIRRKHPENQSFSCHLCEQKFNFETYLHQHLKMVHNCKIPQKVKMIIAAKRTVEGLLICDLCQEELPDARKLRIHKANRHGLFRKECPYCDKWFVESTAYRYHLNSHTGNLEFKCHLCRKAFASQANLNLHMITHYKKNPLFCRGCRKLFVSEGNFKTHIEEFHIGKFPFVCPKCYMGFHDVQKYKVHIDRSHRKDATDEEKKFVCSACNQRYFNKDGFKNHFKRCRGKLKGDSLNKETNSNSDKNNSGKSLHEDKIRETEAIREYLCKICHFLFSTNAGLVAHFEKEHPKEDPSNETLVCINTKCYSQQYGSKDNYFTSISIPTTYLFYCKVCHKSIRSGNVFECHIQTMHPLLFNILKEDICESHKDDNLQSIKKVQEELLKPFSVAQLKTLTEDVEMVEEFICKRCFFVASDVSVIFSHAKLNCNRNFESIEILRCLNFKDEDRKYNQVDQYFFREENYLLRKARFLCKVCYHSPYATSKGFGQHINTIHPSFAKQYQNNLLEFEDIFALSTSSVESDVTFDDLASSDVDLEDDDLEDISRLVESAVNHEIFVSREVDDSIDEDETESSRRRSARIKNKFSPNLVMAFKRPIPDFLGPIPDFFKCACCDKSRIFNSFDAFEDHHVEAHPDLRYECKICTKVSLNSEDHDCHIEISHRVNIPEDGKNVSPTSNKSCERFKPKTLYFCKLCDQAYFKIASLVGHLNQSHSDVKIMKNKKVNYKSKLDKLIFTGTTAEYELLRLKNSLSENVASKTPHKAITTETSDQPVISETLEDNSTPQSDVSPIKKAEPNEIDLLEETSEKLINDNGDDTNAEKFKSTLVQDIEKGSVTFPTCNAPALTRSDLKSRFKSALIYDCPVCGQMYTREKHMINHVSNLHPDFDKTQLEKPAPMSPNNLPDPETVRRIYRIKTPPREQTENGESIVDEPQISLHIRKCNLGKRALEAANQLLDDILSNASESVEQGNFESELNLSTAKNSPNNFANSQRLLPYDNVPRDLNNITGCGNNSTLFNQNAQNSISVSNNAMITNIPNKENHSDWDNVFGMPSCSNNVPLSSTTNIPPFNSDFSHPNYFPAPQNSGLFNSNVNASAYTQVPSNLSHLIPLQNCLNSVSIRTLNPNSGYGNERSNFSSVCYQQPIPNVLNCGFQGPRPFSNSSVGTVISSQIPLSNQPLTEIGAPPNYASAFHSVNQNSCIQSYLASISHQNNATLVAPMDNKTENTALVSPRKESDTDDGQYDIPCGNFSESDSCDNPVIQAKYANEENRVESKTAETPRMNDKPKINAHEDADTKIEMSKGHEENNTLTPEKNNELDEETKKRLEDCRSKALFCGECPTVYYFRKRYLLKHYLEHHSECQEKIEELTKDLGEGDSRNVWSSKATCNICDKEFSSKSNMFTHVRTVHRKADLSTCDVCQKTFSCKGTLSTHKKFVHGEFDKVTCPVCCKTFSTVRNMQKHKENLHDNLDKHPCSDCVSSFRTKHELKRHRRENHRSEKTSQKCDGARRKNLKLGKSATEKKSKRPKVNKRLVYESGSSESEFSTDDEESSSEETEYEESDTPIRSTRSCKSKILKKANDC